MDDVRGLAGLYVVAVKDMALVGHQKKPIGILPQKMSNFAIWNIYNHNFQY